jgi:hypothetical protein
MQKTNTKSQTCLTTRTWIRKQKRRGFATQFSVGVNYWSSVHIEKDFYYKTLSCLSSDRNDKSILFYFVFPSYGVSVPMRSGDVICFNPIIYHYCTNPVAPGVRIFSCYVSAKRATLI